jgi:hypothetical protein
MPGTFPGAIAPGLIVVLSGAGGGGGGAGASPDCCAIATSYDTIKNTVNDKARYLSNILLTIN